MDHVYKPGKICIKIKSTSSMAKSISILRKYNPIPISDLKTAIETGKYVLECPYISTPGARMIRRCYDELSKAGNDVELYEHDRLTTREFLCNVIKSHREIEREVRAQVDAEVAAEGGDDD